MPSYRRWTSLSWCSTSPTTLLGGSVAGSATSRPIFRSSVAAWIGLPRDDVDEGVDAKMGRLSFLFFDADLLQQFGPRLLGSVSPGRMVLTRVRPITTAAVMVARKKANVFTPMRPSCRRSPSRATPTNAVPRIATWRDLPAPRAPRAPRRAGAGHLGTTRTPGICRKVSASVLRWRWFSWRNHRCCCWTSPPEVSTTRPSGA